MALRAVISTMLYMYVGPTCFGCDTAHAIAHEMRTRNLPNAHIRVGDPGDPDTVRLASVFAVPTHRFRGRVLSVGNPERLATRSAGECPGKMRAARGRIGDEIHSTYGIGVNPLTSDRPLWYTLADCVASKLRTGNAPRVIRALRYVPDAEATHRPA